MTQVRKSGFKLFELYNHMYSSTVYVCAVAVLQLLLPDGKVKTAQIVDNLLTFIPVSIINLCV